MQVLDKLQAFQLRLIEQSKGFNFYLSQERHFGDWVQPSELPTKTKVSIHGGVNSLYNVLIIHNI